LHRDIVDAASGLRETLEAGIGAGEDAHGFETVMQGEITPEPGEDALHENLKQDNLFDKVGFGEPVQFAEFRLTIVGGVEPMFEGVLVTGLGAMLARGNDAEKLLFDLFVGEAEALHHFAGRTGLFAVRFEAELMRVGDSALEAGDGKNEGLKGGEVLVKGEGAGGIGFDPTGGTGDKDLEELEIGLAVVKSKMRQLVLLALRVGI
jgi:hypothetical protein